MNNGLSSAEAAARLSSTGPNEIPEKHASLTETLAKTLVSPITLMLVLAAGLSFFAGKMFDGYFILLLLAFNSMITLWQEHKADSAIQALNKHLDQQIRVWRDDHWQTISSRLLVPGDHIQLTAGEVVPADGTVLEVHHLSVNESALTGESLPLDKAVNDPLWSGSYIAAGLASMEVTATGTRTKFGKTLLSVERIRQQSLLEKDILSITQFLTILSILSVVLLSAFFLLRHASVLDLLTLDLSLVIAGIPISLPTVMTLIIEVGVLHLARKQVIVRRLSALEDLANVTYLLTDKTGTLTENKITVQSIFSYQPYTTQDVMASAITVASLDEANPIHMAILEKAGADKISPAQGHVIQFTPADSQRKHSTAAIQAERTTYLLALGAPQVIASTCVFPDGLQTQFQEQVTAYAKDGYRTLAIARVDGTAEREMTLMGLIALSDTLRPDSQSVVAFLKENGITVTMVTGDNRFIASHIARQLNLDDGTVMTKDQLDTLSWKTMSQSVFQSVGAFAEILPEDKLHLVQRARECYIVAADGDGINDLPAVKAAHVGIAVQTAVPALKAAADIVLLSEGLSVIKDAIIESRKIFARVYTYSLYRISESFRLIMTIAILGLLFGQYPMTPLQIILIALLNDVPIISLAFDHVHVARRPAKIKSRERFFLSSLYGLVGVANSLLLFLLVHYIWHLPWELIQTMYFLKLTVSGHLLIFVAHTPRRWYTFLPSKEVILATVTTQGIATLLAATGFLMPAKIPFSFIVFIWIWAFFWMQISELMKIIQQHRERKDA